MRAHSDRMLGHAALIIDSDESLDRLLVSVLRQHVAAGEPVLVVVGPRTERVLRSRLGSAGDAIEWAPADAFYRRLGHAYEGFRRYLEQQHALGRKVHVIAEPGIVADPSSPVDRVAAYLSYESMCNDVYAPYGCPVTCIWDSRRYPRLVIEVVRSIHEHELTEHGRQPSDGYIAAAEYLAARAGVAMPPAPAAADIDMSIEVVDELVGCRSAVRAWASALGFSAPAALQVTTAANEVMTNGVLHGAPPVRLRTWHHGTTLVVQVDDRGSRPIPPDAGYWPPSTVGDAMGLWVARQYADVLLANTCKGQTSVRMYFPHGVTHR